MRGKRILWYVLQVIAVLLVTLPFSAYAEQPQQKVVRVGWYESAWHRTDPFGRRSGYGYEYQQRVATYTGWKYEYVEGSWSELLVKLMQGEIDLLSDVSYTEERAQKLLYSSEAMGSESFHIFIRPDNTTILPDDFSTMNGKRVGVNKNSIQAKFFKAWVEKHDVHPQIIELTDKTPRLLEMLAKGDIDMLVTLDTYANTANVVPVCKVGAAESFFGINKNRPDLKRELDAAMNEILETNRDYNELLAQRFNKTGSINSFLTTEEREWLTNHGVIRIGYRDKFLPFSATDEKTQKVTGSLADYLNFAARAFKNAKPHFEARAFSNTQDALAALSKGEIDCVFPINFSPYDGEKLGIIVTDPLIVTEMYAVVRSTDRQDISPKRTMRVAMPRGNRGYESFLKDHFPGWQVSFYTDEMAAIEAVIEAKADCVLVSNYRISRLNNLMTKHNLVPLSTGEAMDMSFALRKQDTNLYSMLNKVNRLVPKTTLNSALTRYAFEDTKVTFAHFMRDNLPYVIALAAILAAVFLWLQVRRMRAEAKAEEGQQIISKAERDYLTNLYSWNFFLLYAGRICSEKPDQAMDAVVLNIERFHSVNALHGREFGDRVLRSLADEIQRFAAETGSIASRFEADRFDIYSPHREDWQVQLERFQAKLDELFHNANIRLRMGVKPWQKGMEPIAQFDLARTACNKLRGTYKTQAVIFDYEMEKREERDQRLLNDLGQALEKGELEVFYQPKYDIRPDRPMLASAEALVRWRHPDMGLIFPGEFIPLFEQSGQISRLDSYVWKEAARQAAVWRKRFDMALPVSVNLSRIDVFDPNLIADMDKILVEHKLGPGDFNLEVTESAYTENPDQLIQVIEELRRKGYKIEMDDFGSGYSSLNMLSSMPVDVLKMDMAFVRNIERNEKDFHFVKLIIEIAHTLNIPVIAEGVETEGQLKLLKAAKCDMVQGYYFSAPLPANEFERKILKGAERVL